ncbi:MAG TPA: hypothetical protein VJ583_03920 [Nitrososphaeraceae archaeon]|nr:hypothetical protein [Nitrososphaeraceae archaeon]
MLAALLFTDISLVASSHIGLVKIALNDEDEVSEHEVREYEKQWFNIANTLRIPFM